MKMRLFYIFCMLLLPLMSVVAADEWYRLRLKTGMEYECQIELKNDNVIIFRTVQNKRFQIPMSDVESVLQIPQVEKNDVSGQYVKRFGFQIYLNGGMAWNGNDMGWNMSGGLQAGATNLFDRHIYLGGGIGVSSYMADKTCLFVPIMVSLSIPFLQSADAPFAGLSGGYGFAVKGAQSGGFYGDIRLGWLHRFESQTAIELSLSMSIQQAVLQATEHIEGEEYLYTAHRVLSTCGIRFAVLL